MGKRSSQPVAPREECVVAAEKQGVAAACKEEVAPRGSAHRGRGEEVAPQGKGRPGRVEKEHVAAIMPAGLPLALLCRIGGGDPDAR